jgi:hypothetical protein
VLEQVQAGDPAAQLRTIRWLTGLLEQWPNENRPAHAADSPNGS